MKNLLLVFLFLLVVTPFAFAKINYDTKLPLRGATKANAKLQSDTLMAVYTAASVKMPYCNKFIISDTAIIKQPRDNSWTEQWTVRGCGQNVYVPVEFVLDETGATYIINNSKVHF